MTGAKLGAVVMTALTVMYVVLLGQRGILLLLEPNTIAKLMGAGILAFPVVALWAIARELVFGLKIERIAKRLEVEGRWPELNLELRPSGRATRDSATVEFERIKQIVQQDETNWYSWFTLGLAYDAAGDRRRARLAMRKAIELEARRA